MGGIASRRNAGVEEVDLPTSNAYRYPPKSGCYFGSHFIMGGERFDTTQPEAYLFGENQDLNFLGNRPIPFPYPAPQAHEPTKTLKSLVNIRKDSLKFVKIVEEEEKEEKEEGEGEETETVKKHKYNIEFTFDTDVRVAITIYYFASEEISNGVSSYHPKDSTMNSETFHYKRGANQVFSQSTHIIEPAKFQEEEWQYNPDKEIVPIVIQCVVEDEAEYAGHSHMTFAIVEKSSDGGFAIKALKQKQMVDGLCYLLQEIYGIENKNTERPKNADDDIEDTGSECVICMSDVRDTLILPCRHLCLCNGCADSLRYQANNCPICRAPFRALLQIRAMRKKMPSPPVVHMQSDSDDNAISQEGVPPGYEAVSLIEALNGPTLPSAPTLPVSPLQIPPDGFNRGSEAASSSPTTPDGSPSLEKRKAKRHSSTKSNKSAIKERSDLNTEMEADTEGKAGGDSYMLDPEDGRGTPEVVMSEMNPDPVKSEGPQKMVLPKIRYPANKSAKKDETVKDKEESVEIVNETEQKTSGEEPGVQGATEEESAVGGNDIPHGLTSTPPPGYAEQEDEDLSSKPPIVHIPGEDNRIKPAVRTSALYEQDERQDSDPLSIPNSTLEASLPGTPISTTDGSSFSSTSSSRGLLAHTTPEKNEDEKPVA